MNEELSLVGPAVQKKQKPGFELLQELRNGFLLSTLRISVPELPECFDGFRLLQLTDLHYGPVTKLSHIRKAVELSNSLAPNVVLLTGDYIQNFHVGIKHFLHTKVNRGPFRWSRYRRQVRDLAVELGRELENLDVNAKIIGVFGNHDYLDGLSTIMRYLPANVEWLVNEQVHIENQGERVGIYGLDDLWRGQASLKDSLLPSEDDYLSKEPFLKILLSHNPDIILSPDEHLISEMDLMLSGHTHGGQICLPGWGPIISRTSQKTHVKGLSYHRDTAVYVSHGVGYGLLPLRLGCPPEIVLLELCCAE